MSFTRGWNATNLIPQDTIPHTEFISHDAFTLETAGVDTRIPEERGKAWPALARALDFDFVWNQCEMPLTQGRVTRLGHAVWSETNPVDHAVACPFATVDEVLEFDPVAEYGVEPHEAIVTAFQGNLDACKKLYPDCVFPGGRYHSVFSACIDAFGWEMFMMAVMTDPERFGKVIEGFAARTEAEVRAWLDTDIKVFLMHDDIVWTSGPVFPPEWYRKYIFPHYADLWKMIKAKGLKIIFCADGDYNLFVDDIADCGADGFIFEPTTSLEYITAKYGETHVIIGNVDCRVLQFGSQDDIRREVERCVNLGRACPGYFFNASNHLPNGIPMENIRYYMRYSAELRGMRNED